MAEYYFSSNATEPGDGSREKPWVMSSSIRSIGGGNTFIFLPGRYHPIDLKADMAGTPEAPTVLRAEPKWQAMILPNRDPPTGGCGIVNPKDGSCPWVTVDGFETSGNIGDGVRLFGEGCVVRNCWSHLNYCQGIQLPDSPDALIERNLVERNGVHCQFAHGMYLKGPRVTVRSNIVRHNAGGGIHLTPTANGSLVAYNLCHNNHKDQLLCGYDAPSSGNRILHNTLIGSDIGCLRIRNNEGCVIGNNILVGKRMDPLVFEGENNNVEADYNLRSRGLYWRSADSLVPDMESYGILATVEWPNFFEPARGLYWLKEDSPARNAGSLRYSMMAAGLDPDKMPTDFWGQPIVLPAPDLGCFSFRPDVLLPAYRERWYAGWSYGYPGYDLVPDLWRLP